MRAAALMLVFVIISGCTVAKGGMTLEEFKSSCKSVLWANATEIPLTTGDVIAECNGGNYQLFEEGVIKRLISVDEAKAILEHDRCVSFGAVEGSPDYLNCRLSLAQMRTQQEAVATAQRQQASQALLFYGMALQNMNRPATPTTVNVQANCTSHQMGAYTSYTCR